MRLLTIREMAIRERVDIEAPIEEVFDFGQDQLRRVHWDPFVQEIIGAPLEGDYPTVGTMVDVTAWNGLKMKCLYLKYDRPHLVTIKMVGGIPQLKRFAGTWRFIFLDENRTAVVFLYNFTLVKGYEWLTPIVRTYFRWDMTRRLNALKRETEARFHPNNHPLAA